MRTRADGPQTPLSQRMARLVASALVAVLFGMTVATTVHASPNIETITRKTPTGEHTDSNTLTWLLTFTEAVTDVDPTDFVVSGTTATLAMKALAVDGEGCSEKWDATLSGGDLPDLNGTVSLTPADFDRDDHTPCPRGPGEPCIWGCLGNGEAMTNPRPRGTNHNTFVVTNDNDGASSPVAQFAMAAARVSEGAGSRNVSLNLSPAPAATLTLHYTLSGTAMQGSDYRISGVTSSAGTVVVSSGATTATIPVTIINDSTNEGNETVELTLEPGDGYTVGSPSTHTLTITDDDGGGGGGSGDGSGGGGGGGGGGGSQPRDRHGNTPADATPVRLRATAPWASSTAGEINSRRDVDYFTLTAPHAGVLVVETTGGTDTVGTVWQAGEELATAIRGGTRRNFRLTVRVKAGAVVIAVAGNGGRTGAYRLETRLMVGYLENPGPNSFQSGVGVISGWVCEADAVEIEITQASGAVQRYAAGYGTERLDTARYSDGRRRCGDTDNGFGLLFNWNRLEDGEHTVVAWVDEVELGRATVTVTTFGQEFVEDAVGTCEVEDFPTPGETVTVVWQQSSQNFVIAAGLAPTAPTRAGEPGVGYLEIPTANSFQSGVGVISGWVCEAEAVEIEITTEDGEVARYAASYGTERLDTARREDGTPICGDTDNGFGLLFNWNRLGDGEHTVVALVDGAELGRAVVRVTTLGDGAEEEFLPGAEGECVVENFPLEGQTVTLEWQQTSQNFVITDAAEADDPFARWNALEPRDWWRDSAPYTCRQEEKATSPWLEAGLADLGGSDPLSLIRYFGNGSYLRYGHLGFHGCTRLKKYPDSFQLDPPADPAYYALGDLVIHVDLARVPPDASGWDLDDGARVGMSVTDAVALLNTHVAAYFRRVSGDRLRITFRAGHEFAVPGDGSPDAAENERNRLVGVCPEGCEHGAPGGLNRILLNDVASDTGGSAYNGSANFGLATFRDANMETIVHEIGHGWMAWPHSFAEVLWRPSAGEDLEPPNPYSNFYDIMSALDLTPITGWDARLPAPLAVNRYAAGWIDAADVALHLDDRATYTLHRPFEAGAQFLVVHSGRRFAFTTLEVLEERADRFQVARAEVYDPTAADGRRPRRYAGVLVSRYDQSAGTGTQARFGPALYDAANPDFLSDVGWGRDDHALIPDGGKRAIGGGVTVGVARNEDGSYAVTVSGGRVATFERWCEKVWFSTDEYDTGCFLDAAEWE